MEEVPKKKRGCLTGCLAVVAIFLLFGVIIGACTGNDDDKTIEDTQQATNKSKDKEAAEDKEKPADLTPQEKMIAAVQELFTQDLAFDAGNYIQGDIPKGEYAFIRFSGSGQYYVEKNQNGDIHDNENFDSFGYVLVQGIGNITNDGLLVSTSAFSTLGVSGAKELYEIINNKSDYNDAGWYKVGLDLPAGTYTLESYGEGYVAKMAGPVGNSDIIDNEIFNGRYQVTVSDGQYLKVSSAVITQ